MYLMIMMMMMMVVMMMVVCHYAKHAMGCLEVPSSLYYIVIHILPINHNHLSIDTHLCSEQAKKMQLNHEKELEICAQVQLTDSYYHDDGDDDGRWR